ncbi:MAG: prepilin peptidase [Candidatus Hydrogenedentes bacterium]|nr:prepilin peptidase [Candidatus Hydrogenedentota bacterium]
MHFSEFTLTIQVFFLGAAFILGTVIGSFCNVCISRWPSGASVVQPRSRCPKCLNSIAWYDNIPLLSWIILRARCRHCKTPISAQYPLVELITGLLFMLVFRIFGFTPAAAVYMLFSASMVIVTAQDLNDWTIPDEISITGIPVGIVLSLAGMYWHDTAGLRVTSFYDSVAGVVLGGGILMALDRITVWVLKKPGMGFGDVKLLAMIGAFLGWRGVLGTLVIASVLGSVVGFALILYFRFKGEAEQKPEPEKDVQEEAKVDPEEQEITLEGHYLPFGPWLAIGALLFLFWGQDIINSYLSMINVTPVDPILLYDDLSALIR